MRQHCWIKCWHRCCSGHHHMSSMVASTKNIWVLLWLLLKVEILQAVPSSSNSLMHIHSFTQLQLYILKSFHGASCCDWQNHKTFIDSEWLHPQDDVRNWIYCLIVPKCSLCSVLKTLTTAGYPDISKYRLNCVPKSTDDFPKTSF